MKKLALSVVAALSAVATISYAGDMATFNCGDFRLVRHVNDYNYETPTFDELIDSKGDQIAYSDKKYSDFMVVVQDSHVVVKMRGQSYSCEGGVGGPNSSGE